MFFFSCLLTDHWYWFAPDRDLTVWYHENFPEAENAIPERLVAELTAVAAWNRRREWRKTLAVFIGEGRNTVDAIAEFEVQTLPGEGYELEELAHQIYARAANHDSLELHEFSMLPTASGESIATLETYSAGELVFRYRSWSQVDERHTMNLTITTRDAQFLPNVIETGQIATESMVFERGDGMTFAARVEPEFTFMLPGNWWRITLLDDESRLADIRKIAVDAFGKADNAAKLRADLRTELTKATDLAVEGDADSMYFAREVIQGVPLPVSLVVTYTADYAGISPIQSERNLETLVNSVDRIADGNSDDADDDYVLGESAVVRRIRRQEPKEIADSEIAGRAPSLSVNYWISVPKRNRVLVMAFQTAFTDLKEPLLDLYNAIVESIRWNVPDQEPDEMQSAERPDDASE